MNKDIIESNHWHFLLFFFHTHRHIDTHTYTLENPKPTTHHLAYYLANNNHDIFRVIRTHCLNPCTHIKHKSLIVLEKNTRFKLYMVFIDSPHSAGLFFTLLSPIRSRVLQHEEVCDTRHTQLKKGNT